MDRVNRYTQLIARSILVILLAALPVVAGKLFAWQTMLVALVVLITAILFLVGLLGKFQRAKLGVVDYALIGALVWAAVSMTQTVYLHASLLALVQLLSYFMAFWLARTLLDQRPWQQAAVGAILIGGLVSAVWGLNEYVRTAAVSGQTTWRIYGPFFNPNLLAGYLLIALPLAVAVVWWNRTEADSPVKPLLTIASGFVMLLMAAALLLTGSKGGLVAAAVVIVVLAFTLPRRGTHLARRVRWLTIVVLVVGIGVALLTPPLRVRILSAFTTQRRSAAFRYYTWVATTQMIGQRPLLGFGPGSYEYVQPQFAIAGFTRAAHQTLLQIAAETGLPSLVLLLVGLSAITIELSRRTRRAPPGQRLLAAAALAAFAGFWMHNLIDYSWYVPAVGVTVWMLVGMALADEPQPEVIEEAPSWLKASRIAAIAVLLIGGWLLTRGLHSQALAAQAEELLREGIPTAAVARIRRAVALDPLDSDHYDNLAAFLAAQAEVAGRSKLQEAIATQRHAIALAPTQASLHRKLAYLYAQVGDLLPAIAAAQKAVQLYPNYTKGWITLAELQATSGDAEAALVSYRRVTELYFSPVREYAAIGELSEPGYAEAWQTVGRDALNRGDDGYASFALGMAAKVFTAYFRQVPLRREIMKLQGQWDEARYQQMRTMASEVAQQLVNLHQPLGLLRAGELYIALENTAAGRQVLGQLCQQADSNILHTPLEKLIVGRGCIDLAALEESSPVLGVVQKLRSRGRKLIQANLAALDSQLLPPDWEEDDTYIVRYMLQHGQPPPPSPKILLVTGGQ